jgi:hypothetical protein
LTNLRSTTLAGRTRARLGARVRQAADVERQICARQRAGATAGSAEQSGGSIVAWSRSVTHEAVAVAGQVRRHLLIIFHPNTLQSPSLPLCLLTYLTAPWVAGCPWRSHPPSLPLSHAMYSANARNSSDSSSPIVRGPDLEECRDGGDRALTHSGLTTVLTLYLVRAAPPLLLLSQPQSPHQHPRGRQQ